VKLTRLLTQRRVEWLPAALLWMQLGCQSEASVQAPRRGNDPWFFASTAQDDAATLVLALRTDLWVEYDLERAALLRVSSGPLGVREGANPRQLDVRGDGAGLSLLTSAVGKPWRVLREGRELEIAVRGRGYRQEGDRIVLEYMLQYEDRVMYIEERPEAVLSHDGTVGLERRFHMRGAPGELRVMLEFNAPALGSYDDIQLLSGEGEVRGLLTVTSSYDQRLLMTFPAPLATERQ
jgi:hypothetical protein